MVVALFGYCADDLRCCVGYEGYCAQLEYDSDGNLVVDYRQCKYWRAKLDGVALQ